MKTLLAEPFEIENIEDLKEWLSSEDVYKNMYILYRPMNTEELVEWYENEKYNNANIFRYISEDKITGMGMVHHIHSKNRCSELSFIVNPHNAGKGFGARILDHLLRYSFHVLNLNKVFLHTAEFNKRVFSMAENRGFVLEGTFRREIYYSGKYYDTYRFGMLQDEYEKNIVDLA